MKVGIITFHFPYNCGATLQCTALQTELERQGNEVEVINYRPWYHQNRYTPYKNPFYLAKKGYDEKKGSENSIKCFGRGVYWFFRTIKSWKNHKDVEIREKKFAGFVEEYLHETKVYRSIDKLRKNPPACGMYICGSDQLWNAGLTAGGIDKAYLLDFGKESTGRMSYAVGADFSKMESVDGLKADFNRFDVISLRETTCQDAINTVCEGKVPLHIDVDPTLLLQADDYEKFISKEELEKEPFILTYVMPNVSQGKVRNAAKMLSEKTGYKVIDICGNPTQFNLKAEDFRVSGPADFLWYVKNAKYVVTNSFHGTAFSLIYHKQFVTIPHPETGYRVTELLDKVGLHKRWMTNGPAAFAEIEKPIDYVEADRLLAGFREESRKFLKASIEKYGSK